MLADGFTYVGGVRYFLELTLQEYSFLHFTPSVTAAAALKIALWFHDEVPWSKVTHRNP